MRIVSVQNYVYVFDDVVYLNDYKMHIANLIKLIVALKVCLLSVFIYMC